MSDFEVRGGDDVLRIAKRLKAQGQGEIRKALLKALRESAKPLVPKTRAAALSRLPSRGGLAALVAREPQRVRVRTGQSTAGVQIVVGKRGGGARAADLGAIRHPVFGGPAFVVQSVPPGWFSETAQGHAPAIRDDIRNTLREVERAVTGRG